MFQLKQERPFPYSVVREYVSDRNFFSLCIRKMGGVVLETNHPRLSRKVFADIDQAIAAVGKLGWKVTA